MFFQQLASTIKATAQTVTETINKTLSENQELEKKRQELAEEQKRREDKRIKGYPAWRIRTEEKSILEPELKKNIIELAKNEQDFIANYKQAKDFPFDIEVCENFCLEALKADPQLDKLRFKLVPLKMSDVDFWKYFFFRVSNMREKLMVEPLPIKQASLDAMRQKKDFEMPVIKKDDTDNKNPETPAKDNQKSTTPAPSGTVQQSSSSDDYEFDEFEDLPPDVDEDKPSVKSEVDAQPAKNAKDASSFSSPKVTSPNVTSPKTTGQTQSPAPPPKNPEAASSLKKEPEKSKSQEDIDIENIESMLASVDADSIPSELEEEINASLEELDDSTHS